MKRRMNGLLTVVLLASVPCLLAGESPPDEGAGAVCASRSVDTPALSRSSGAECALSTEAWATGAWSKNASRVSDVRAIEADLLSPLRAGAAWPLAEESLGPARPLFPFEQLLGRGTVPVAFCFAPGASPEVITYYSELIFRDPNGTRYQLGGRWSGGQGNPRSLRWSFVPDGLSVDGGTSELFSRMDSLFGGNRALWIARFTESFARWAELSGLSHTRVTSGGNDWDDGSSWGVGGSTNRGDVRIAMIWMDGSSGVLAYNYFPANGDMVLDRSENWGSSSGSHRFLRNVVMHEHGHGVGLYHVCPTIGTKLMEPMINTSYDGLRHDDIRAAQRHYGDPYETDNTFSTAVHIGTASPGAPISIGSVPSPYVSYGSLLSIDANSEQDWFRFTTASAAFAATVTVTPIGHNYDDSAQSCGGWDGCCSGSFTDSMNIADLAVRIYASNGTTILGEASSAPRGDPETLSYVVLGPAGDYYLRVYETDSPSQSQLYSFTLSVVETDCDGNGIPDNCDLDCGSPGGDCDVPGCGQSLDCNGNFIPDDCDVAVDDCNSNGIPDDCDITAGTSIDCNGNESPDECEIDENSSAPGGPFYCTRDCDPDCDDNGVPDECDVAALITSQPGNLIRCPGTTAVFAVSNVGSATYQWYKDDVPDPVTLTDAMENISGATSDTLTVSNVQSEDSGNYFCEVAATSQACIKDTTDYATLTVVLATTIDSHPGQPNCVAAGNCDSNGVDVWACEDDVKLLAVEAHANEAGNDPTYQWQQRISQNPDQWDDVVGETQADLSVSYALVNDNATYRCKVASALCPDVVVISYAVTQRVVHAEFTRQPAGPSGTLCVEPGETAVLWVDTSSTHTVQWYQWWTDASGDWTYVGATNTLTIENADSGDQGNYYVTGIVESPFLCRIDSDQAFLQVGGCPSCSAPAGNMDGDTDVDLADMAAFMECFGVDVAAFPECLCADIDGNNLVELDDWALFVVTGP